MHHIGTFGRPMPQELWHYTDANGLVEILKTGKLWSTQVACLNDTFEQRYFGDLIHEEVKKVRAGNQDRRLDPLLRIADEALAFRDFSTAGHFVACFSEVEDDLGQWRGYGGGECGYAIGFRPDGITQAIAARQGALLLPMNYNAATQSSLVNDVLRIAQIYFLDGLQRGISDPDKWAREFLVAFSVELDIFASLIKHPKFSGELERRIATTLKPGEHQQLEFRQKRTLLARHLPIDLTISTAGRQALPITRVYVGPGPSQQVSRISVGDLLLKYGYQGIPVEKSKVPYRIP